MLIIKNSSGGGTNLINSGIKNADDAGKPQDPNKNSNIDLYKLIGNEDFPVGTIMLFDGPKADVKPPWYFCDGSHGTPPLEGKFIRCVNHPNDANSEKTGGYSDSSVPNHTHTITIETAGKHKHSLPDKTFTTTAAGKHRHIQHNSPRHGIRAVYARCGGGKGNHKINDGVYRRQNDRAEYSKYVKKGVHTHEINLPNDDSSLMGNHNHNYVYLTGNKGVSGTGKNLPRHKKWYHIMKVR